MILDNKQNSRLVERIHPAFKQVFDFIKSVDCVHLAPGKIELDGEKVYITVAEVEGKAKEEAFLETHRDYIDVQFLLEGEETYGWMPAGSLKEVKVPYRNQEDIAFFSDRPDFYFTLKPGEFVVFFPGEGHAPCIGSGKIKKAIAKIKIS